MLYTKLPEELEPTDEDFVHFAQNHDLAIEDTEEYYRMAWKDYISGTVKDDFDTYKSEMRDDWREEKDSEPDTPSFKEWHEAMHDFIPTLENYITKNKDEVFRAFKEYVKEYCDPSDYFEID